MIRVRDDDVLSHNRYYTYETALPRFKEVHRVIVEGGAVHVAAVICGQIHRFYGLPAFLREQYENGTLIPEIHGWDHVSYVGLPVEQVEMELGNCIKVIKAATGYTPAKFYSPFGATSPELIEVASSLGLDFVDTSSTLYPKKKVFGGKGWASNRARVLSGCELLIHWWEDKWLDSESHSLANTLRVINENDPGAFRAS